MNKEFDFLNYEQALALKELGFDKPCFKKYIAGCLWSSPTTPETYQKIHPNSSDCSAPLFQQAFRWFREKYGLNYKIEEVSQVRFQARVYKGDGWATWDFGYKFNTYEEAELACLKKLIEIVKSKNN